MKKLTPLSQQFLLTYLVLAISFIFGFYITTPSYVYLSFYLDSSYQYYYPLMFISVISLILFITLSIFYAFRALVKHDLKDLNKVWGASLWILFISFIISIFVDLYSNIITYVPGHGIWANIKYAYYSILSIDFLMGLILILPYILLAWLTYRTIKVNKKLI